MFDWLVRWLGIGRRDARHDEPGDPLSISVAGVRWKPVRSLAACGPADPCYIVRVDSAGEASLVFGDGVQGARPQAGARIVASYRSGSGSGGNVPEAAEDPSVALVEVWSYVADLLAAYQDRIAAEAYLETSEGRRSIHDATDLRDVFVDETAEPMICLRLRATTRRDAA